MRAVSKAILGVTAVGLIAAAQPYARPPALVGVGIEQKLNAQVPLDLEFKNEAGKAVKLREYFQGRPVVLSLVYYRCPMLCNLVMNGELRSFRQVSSSLGKDFDAVTVSFDPQEGPDVAAAKKATYVDKYNRAGAAESWHFLTGSEQAIRALASSVGFNYSWDPKTNQWAHASGIMVLTADGRISRYLYGIEYTKNDMRLALREASAGKIGSLSDQIMLFCFHYDPTKGKYTFAIMNVLRAGGSATALALGLFMFVNFRRDRRREAIKQR